MHGLPLHVALLLLQQAGKLALEHHLPGLLLGGLQQLLQHHLMTTKRSKKRDVALADVNGGDGP